MVGYTPPRLPQGRGDAVGWPKPRSERVMGETLVVAVVVVVFVVVDVAPFTSFSSNKKNS